MNTCYVEYHSQDGVDEKFEKELDALLRRHGLTREGSGFRVDEGIRDIRYEAHTEQGE